MTDELAEIPTHDDAYEIAHEPAEVYKAGLRRMRVHRAQYRIVQERARYNLLRFGRRWGKSALLFMLAYEVAGPGGVCGYAAPSAKDYAKRWNDALLFFAPVLRNVNVTSGIMWLDRGRMEWFGLHRDVGIRGNKYHRFIADEAAYAPRMFSQYKTAIRPTLGDYKGDMYVASTPNGKQNDFYLIEQAFAKRRNGRVFVGTAYENSYVDPAEIDEAREDMSEAEFAQEYLAEYVDLGGGMVREEFIKRAAFRPDGLTWSAGVDLAISQRDGADFTAIVSCAVDEAGRVYLYAPEQRHVGLHGATEFVDGYASRHGVANFAVESNGYQIAQAENLLRYTNLAVVPVDPRDLAGPGGRADKVARFQRLLSRYERGLVHHVESEGMAEYERQLFAFGKKGAGEKKDLVDAAVYAYWIASGGAASFSWDWVG